MMNLERRMNLIQHNLEIGGYTIVAKECVSLIEQALRQLFREQLTRLDEKDRFRVQEAERKKGKGQRGVEQFTMGQLVNLFHTSQFLEAWERASGKDLKSLRVINLDELTRLRNDLIHNNHEATRSEAEFLLHCLGVIFETFDLESFKDSEETKGNVSQDSSTDNISVKQPEIPSDMNLNAPKGDDDSPGRSTDKDQTIASEKPQQNDRDNSSTVLDSTHKRRPAQTKLSDRSLFDVFLCHHSEDKPLVKEIGKCLKERGISPWLDEWELPPGSPWQKTLEEQIEKIRSAAVFVGKNGIGPWQRRESEAVLNEFVERGCPVIPVLLRDAPKKPDLPLFLKGFTWVDFRKDEPDPIEQLIWGVTGNKPITTPKKGKDALLPGKFSFYKRLLGVIVLGLVIFSLFSKTYLQVVELKTRDLKFKFNANQVLWKTNIKDNKKLIIVSLGNSFLRNFDNKVSQEKLTSLIQQLSERKPKVIGLDFLLDEGKKGYNDLVEAIKTAGNVILPVDFQNPEGSKKIQREFPGKIGFANFCSEFDNSSLVRRVFLEETDGNYCYYEDTCYPFALQLLNSFYDDKGIEKILEDHPKNKKFLTINFDRHSGEFARIEVDTLENIEKETFENKILLIGYLGEKSSEDEFFTPLSTEKIKGLLLHAYTLNTIDLKQYIRSWITLDLGIILFFALLGVYFSLKFGRVLKFLMLSITWICYVGITLCLFHPNIRLDIPLWSPMITLTLSALLNLHTSQVIYETSAKKQR